MYAFGAQSVKCAACNYITATSTPEHGSVATPGDGVAPQMVVVENPPTLDESGNVVSNMAVGVVA